MSAATLVRKLREALVRLGLRNGSVLLAVSGGADSLAMLHAVAELRERLGLRVEVACIDHGLRRGSADDVRFVRGEAKRLGVRFHTERVSIRGRTGIEARARRERYRALGGIAERRKLDFVATAHTAEDQAETLLFRLARGAGLRGARGILERRGQVVRPMLAIRRAEVLAFLEARGLTPREDPTNVSHQFTRNRIRALVLPALEEALGEGAIDGLARFARLAADDEAWLARRARRTARELLVESEGELGGEAAALARLPAAIKRRVLRQAARSLGLSLSMAQILELEEALSARRPRTLSLAKGVEFQVRYGRFRFWRPAAHPPPRSPSTGPIDAPGIYPVGDGWLEIRAVEGPGPAAPGSMRILPSAVALPLSVRTRRPGDRYRPRGSGSRKLKELLIDEKVPRERRDALPLLCDADGQILWIPGLRPSAAAQAGERAREAWEIVWRSGSGGETETPLKQPIRSRAKRELGPKRGSK